MPNVKKYKIENYLGSTFNYLTVIGESEKRAADGSPAWTFECVCGNTVFDSPGRVINGHKKSCGCMRYKSPNQLAKKSSARPKSRVNLESYIGKKMNRLTVIGGFRPDDAGLTKLECICDCGNKVFLLPYQFDRGEIKSCGCARFGHSECHKGNTSRRTHNMTKNRFYKKWNDMIRRCYNPNEPAYRWYGEQGITVCEEWKHTPERFVAWCESTHPGKDGFSLDRINGKEGYSPENCRWATQKEQVHNLKNNRFVTVGNETNCVSEWCTKYKISPGSIYKRVKKGQSFEQAIKELIETKAASVE